MAPRARRAGKIVAALFAATLAGARAAHADPFSAPA
jgi:hypothetical protein